MSDYSSTYNKVTGNVINTTDFSTEFNAIETAVATKADADSDTLTNVTIGSGYSGSTITLDTMLTASGTETEFDFTGISSWVKRITIMMTGLSLGTDGISDKLILKLGDSGGLEATGYSGGNRAQTTNTDSIDTESTYFPLTSTLNMDTDCSVSGHITLTLMNAATNLWALSGMLYDTNTTTPSDGIYLICGTKALSSAMTQFRVTTLNGGYTFDAGSINIAYE